jgi:hypothetical protein
MNLPKEFDEYVKQGIIRKCSVNRSRADFLIEESDRRLRGLCKRIDKMGMDDENSNSIVIDCYDILMELIRARLLLSGYCSAGQFAHEAEISYLRKFNLSNREILFINDLRYFRNSVTYYGKILDVEYAKQVVEFTKKLHPKLKKIIEHNST